GPASSPLLPELFAPTLACSGSEKNHLEYPPAGGSNSMERFGTFTNIRTNESGTAWVHWYEFELGVSPSNPIVFHRPLADLVVEQIRKRCAPAIQSVPGKHLLLLAPGHNAIAPPPE